MTNPPRLTVLAAFPALRATVDRAEFAARFPSVDLVFEPFDIDHRQMVDRSERPHAQHEGEVLTDAQRAAFAAADVVVTLNLPLRLADVAPRLRWVQGAGSGIGQFMASGVDGPTFTNAAGVGAPPIAEWVVAQILSIYKRLPQHREQQRAHVWKEALGSVVAGRRVAMVGVGPIGCEVASRLDALGLRVVGVRRRPRGDEALPRGFSEMHTNDRLIEVAATVDVVVAAVPGIPANVDMFGQAFFAAMPDGSVFLNVGRGSSVDEAALIAALQSGHLRGAAIDVAKHEPLQADDPLWDAPNLQISPHSSASGEGYMGRLWELFCDNLERFLAGEPLRNTVDMQREYGS